LSKDAKFCFTGASHGKNPDNLVLSVDAASVDNGNREILFTPGDIFKLHQVKKNQNTGSHGPNESHRQWHSFGHRPSCRKDPTTEATVAPHASKGGKNAEANKVVAEQSEFKLSSRLSAC